ncbi:MAG: methyltransferase, partial [Candidatus Nezhaarchaeales archaeon]
MKIAFNDMVIYVWKGVYPPSDDTFLLLDNLKLNGGELVLDIGTGTGVLAVKCALMGCYVVGVDINRVAIQNAKFNAKVNNVEKLTSFLCSDATLALRDNCEFDVIVMNPPYLPSTGIPSVDDPSWNGGPDGISLILKVIGEVHRVLSRNGKLYFVFSSLSKYDIVFSHLRAMNLQSTVVAKKKLWFE